MSPQNVPLVRNDYFELRALKKHQVREGHMDPVLLPRAGGVSQDRCPHCPGGRAIFLAAQRNPHTNSNPLVCYHTRAQKPSTVFLHPLIPLHTTVLCWECEASWSSHPRLELPLVYFLPCNVWVCVDTFSFLLLICLFVTEVSVTKVVG